jgi:hypothetical protein
VYGEEIIAAYFKIMQVVQILSCVINATTKIRDYDKEYVSVVDIIFRNGSLRREDT